MRRSIYILIVAIGFIHWHLPGLEAQELTYERLSSELGLSQNMVNTVLQDSKGFLWVGTNNGLNRFDGYRFTTFRYDPFDPLSIPGSAVTCIIEDSRKWLWVVTEQGICWFDPQKEAFYPIPVASNANRIVEDPDGNLWQGSQDKGLLGIILSRQAKQPNQAQYIRTDTMPLPVQTFTSPIWDANGNAFVYSETAGMFRFHFSQKTRKVSLSRNFEEVFKAPEQQAFVQALLKTDQSKSYLLRAFENGRGAKIWTSLNRALYSWNAKQQRLETIPLPDSLLSDAYGNNHQWCFFNSVAEDTHHRFWLAGGCGVFLVNTANGNIQTLSPDASKTEHPLSYGASVIAEDRSGLIWLGSKGKGLLKYNDYARRFAAGLMKGPSIRSLYKTRDGMIWYATPSGMLYYYNPATKQSRRIAEGTLWKDHDLGSAFCYHQDKAGALWVGSASLGLVKISQWQLPKPRIEVYPIHEDEDISSQMAPTRILEDEQGLFWISSPMGVIRFNPANGRHEVLPFWHNQTPLVKNNTFPTIFRDRKGRYWVGTLEGLYLLNWEKKSYQVFKNNRKNPQSLSHNLVKCIAEDIEAPERYLWIGTGGGGLSRFDMDKGVFEHFTEKDGLPDMVVYAILPDKLGNFWLSTNKGLSVFNPKRRSFRNFDQSDGLQNLEFNTLAYARGYDGELMFGGIEGFNHFYAEKMLNANPHVPEVVFTDFKVAGKSVSHKTPGSPLTEAIAYARRIVLSHEDKVISFDFAALDFVDPAKNQFACKMEGFDNDWQPLGSTHSATYTNLSPGTYTFKVRASNNDRVWNEEGASIEIVVLSPWWASWWAYFIYLLIAFGIIYAFYRLQINRNLAKAEASRQKELNNAKTVFLATVSHELRTPLTSIMGFSKIIKKRLEERIFPKLDRSDSKTERAAEQVISNLDIVVNESERLNALINNVLDLSRIESGKNLWREEPLDLSEIINRAIDTANTLLEGKNIELHKNVEAGLPGTIGDPDRILQVMVNLLSNAIKFTPQGRVTVVASLNQVSEHKGARELLIGVKDTGVGIPDHMLRLVFDKFQQVTNETLTDKPQGSGLGLAICKEIVEHHQGRIWAESTLGVGSTFWFTLPIREIKNV